ncbi:MAG: cobyric acid synthase [Methanothrix sp.]
MSRFLVVLGTTSHSGKSTLVAAICRLLSERGLRVAPFKSQNMSLNSWVTCTGGEIGIAQAVQAWAAGVEPTEYMNPILLKPKGDRTSQVIVMGKPVADKSAAEYYRDIEGLKEVVDSSIRELEKEYDYIIVEGAGGAAEINLFDRDIANIYVARLLQSPIILVGDIERGGVFASLFGSVELLPDDIRPLVRGLVINKFRGDPAILGSGLQRLEELTGVPVLGVLPYLDLDIPSEDSVSLGDKRAGPAGEGLEIAVIRLSRISNFTDFEPLERLARVRYVGLSEPLGSPDAVIIPGTKNTVSDLREMQEKGMARQIQSLVNTPVLGICGGYQMLGKEIIDCGIEDTVGAVPGLGLLDATTRFDLYEKRTVQVEKTVTGGGPILEPIRGQKVRGYEIHMGVTTPTEDSAFGDDGAVSESGIVIGTYLHGLFDNHNFRTAFLDFLRSRKKNQSGESESVLSEVEATRSEARAAESDGFANLARATESHLDMKKIWQMLDLD